MVWMEWILGELVALGLMVVLAILVAMISSNKTGKIFFIFPFYISK